jgi:DNA repair protein SbcD/Mre11
LNKALKYEGFREYMAIRISVGGILLKIVHMSDSHLGFQDLTKVDESGRNMIEEMIYSGFYQTINKIIELKPDAVVHAGDVFHRERPAIKPLYIFKQGLEELNNAGIPVIIINGNHDAPKSLFNTSPFIIYEGMDNLNIAHKYRYECFEVGDHFFHCLPFCLDPQQYIEEFGKIKMSGRDVLVMHGMVKSMWGERLNEVGEYELDDNLLKPDFDYIALGHCHGRKKILDNAWYSGSVECFNFEEACQNKGILSVDLSTNEIEPINIYEHKYRIDYPQIDCSGLSSEEIITEICAQFNFDETCNKIVRINLKSVNRIQYENLDHSKLSKIKNNCLHLRISTEYEEEEEMIDRQITGMNLSDEFTKFLEEELSRNSFDKDFKNKIISYGSNLMSKVEKARNMEGPET